jgi:uncharacterized protein YdaU (DUF1376 family)
MHYYQFHIGDYRSSTAHLSNDEDLTYRRLLDMYYDTEKPIPLDIDWVAKRIRMPADLVGGVLRDMFELTPTGYVHARCAQEIAAYHGKIEQASRAGKASAERRLNARSTPVQPTINHEPLTNNQDIEDAYASMSGTAFPPCPQQEILKLYAKHLPHLAQPRVWEGNRAAMLKQRWVQASKPSAYSPEGYKTKEAGLAWWDAFFAYIANDTKLSAGFESNGRSWRPDLVWIVTAGNFAKIIDGKYAK